MKILCLCYQRDTAIWHVGYHMTKNITGLSTVHLVAGLTSEFHHICQYSSCHHA